MRRAILATLALLVLATGCAPSVDKDQPGSSEGAFASNVDVDTPKLRKLRARTDLEPCRPGTREHTDGGLPDVTLPCLGGGDDVNISSLDGPFIVNLWAQNCAPCRKELPIYQQFYEKYGDQVGVVGIDFQDVRPDWALDMARETKVTYPQLADVNGALSLNDPLPNILGLPFLALVDDDGNVAHMEFVVIKSLDQLVDLVEKQLGVTL